LVEWSNDEEETENMFKSIAKTYRSIDHQWLCESSKPQDLTLNLNIKTNGIQENEEEKIEILGKSGEGN
jgi:hypothetical protein